MRETSVVFVSDQRFDLQQLAGYVDVLRGIRRGGAGRIRRAARFRRGGLAGIGDRRTSVLRRWRSGPLQPHLQVLNIARERGRIERMRWKACILSGTRRRRSVGLAGGVGSSIKYS